MVSDSLLKPMAIANLVAAHKHIKNSFTQKLYSESDHLWGLYKEVVSVLQTSKSIAKDRIGLEG